MRLLRRKGDPQAVQIQEIDERHNLSQQVFFRRQAAGWSQEELARHCGTTQAQIANIEAGRVNATLNTMVRLAHAFGCLAHDLLRPLEAVDEWERPHAGDWARLTRTDQARAEAPRPEIVHVRAAFTTYDVLGGYAIYSRDIDTRLATRT